MLVSGMSIIVPLGRVAVNCYNHLMMMVVLVVLLASAYGQQQSCSNIPSPLVCTKIGSENGVPSSRLPQIDANLSDWTTNDATTLVTSVYQALLKEEYGDGQMTIQCQYSNGSSTSTGGVGQLYLAIQVPGLYRFNATDYHQSASIGTMMKLGPDATFVNMGGCPNAAGPGCASVPDVCDSYRVDIYHWELANNDQYAVNPFCRFDDDENVGNEWSAAWAHTNPVDGEPGTYIFELSRPLTTASTEMDVQLVPGGTYSFGIAYWDPYETDEGWTDSGHYVTGCATDWFELQLLDADSTSATNDYVPPATESAPSPNSAPAAAPSPNAAPSPDSAPSAQQSSSNIPSALVSTLFLALGFLS